jgi:hypothetical protein
MPDVFIVGVTKCATTSLYNMLMQHPEVFTQHWKEPHFHFSKHKGVNFKGEADNDTVEQMFITNKSKYERLYDSDMVTIDGSAMNIEDYRALRDIDACYPEARILICLRNPVDRAFSAYSHMKRDVRESLTFRAALEEELSGKRDGHLPIWHYYRCGCYIDKVRFCRELFGDRLMLIDFDDLKKNKEQQMNKICSFLGLHNLEFSEFTSNRSGNPKFKSLQKLMMRKSLAKSLLVFLLPIKFRKKIKNVLLSKNTADKEILSIDDREFLAGLYQEERDKIDGNHQDDSFMLRFYTGL